MTQIAQTAVEAPLTGGLSADERAMLVEMLETSRQRACAAIEQASDQVWNRKPADDRWSAAECAEHLVIAEEALLGLVRGQILAGPANPQAGLEVQGKDGMIVKGLQDRSVKLKTFDFLEPKGAWSDRMATLEAFRQRRDATLECARTNRDPLHHHAAPLDPLGLLDAYQWLLLMAAHTDRHVAQLQEALAA